MSDVTAVRRGFAERSGADAAGSEEHSLILGRTVAVVRRGLECKSEFVKWDWNCVFVVWPSS